MALAKIFGIDWAGIAKVGGIDAANLAKYKHVEVPAGGCSAPVFRSAGEANSTASGNSITIPKPSGTVEGDLLIASIYWNDRNQDPTPPSGWTLLNFVPSGATSSSIGAWFKVAGASEPSDYTWTSTGSVSRRAGTIACFSGSYDADPEDAAVVTTDGSATSAGITTVSDCAMVVYLSGVDAAPGATWTEPSGWTSAGPDNGTASTYIGYYYPGTAGATGTISYNTGQWNFVWAFKRND